jgi:AraC-like DNA-binding protein
MLGSDYLSLAAVQLKAREKWVSRSAGLTFIFVNAGGGQCLWPKGQQHLEPGEVLVLNAASGARLTPAMTRTLLFSFFSVTLEHLFPLLSLKEIPLRQGTSDLFKGLTIYPASRALAAKCHRLLRDVSLELDVNHRGQLMRIVAAILSFEFKHAQPRKSELLRIEGRMRLAFDKLSTADILTLPVPELADRFNCTRRHLTRLFHQQFGCSVANLRMEIRLLRAVSLLRNPEFTVADVALKCGFNHRGLFNQCFKRRFGSSPSQWQTAALKAESRRNNSISDEPNCRLRADGQCPWSTKSTTSSDSPPPSRRTGKTVT